MPGQVYNLPVIDTANRQTILSQGLRVGHIAAGVNADFYWATMTAGIQIAFYIESGSYGFWTSNQSGDAVDRYQALSATVTSVQTNSVPSGFDEIVFVIQPSQLYVDVYGSSEAAYAALSGQGGIPISYIHTGCSISGPQSGVSGERVTVRVLPDSGKIIKNPTQGSSISVYNRNGYISFTFENNTISFTVP